VAPVGADHTSASSDHADQFGTNCSCTTRGFGWETGKKMYDAFSVRGKKLLLASQIGLGPARPACTCGKEPKHFIDNMTNVVHYFSFCNGSF